MVLIKYGRPNSPIVIYGTTLTNTFDHPCRLEKAFLRVFPGLISQGSFLPLFPSIIDLPSECYFMAFLLVLTPNEKKVKQ